MTRDLPPAASPLVVLLHFLGGSTQSWAPVLAALPSGLEGVSVDLPGFGAEAATRGFGVGAMADHVLDRLGGRVAGRAVCLVGHSMGAKVAMAIARRAADRAGVMDGLFGLVLLAGSPPAPEPMGEDKRTAMLGWFGGSAARNRTEAEGYIDDNTAAALARDVRAGVVTDVMRASRDAWTAWLSAGSREDWTSRIGRLPFPALILAGEGDEALGAAAQQRFMVPHFADVRIETLSGVGHLLPLEAPARVAAAIADHVAGVPGPGVPPIPPGYRAFMRSARVSAGTREVLFSRAAPLDPQHHPQVLDPSAMATLRAVTARIVPQPDTARIDIAAALHRDLADGAGDGWRFADLPPDCDAMRAGLRTLDAAARAEAGVAFAAVPFGLQDAMMRRVADGALGGYGSEELNGAQMRLWFLDCCSAATLIYMTHPATLARVGYDGIANGGDGPRKLPRLALGEDDREPWEANTTLEPR